MHSYGHADFVRNTYYVKASYHDRQRGQYANGYADQLGAVDQARRLAEDAAVQDVVLIAEDIHGACIEVFKGVQWFCETELNRKYGNTWTVVTGPRLQGAPSEIPPHESLPPGAQPLPVPVSAPTAA